MDERKSGRPPQGRFKGKTATLTTRITAETRAALDQGAREANLSLSQYVEAVLRRQSFGEGSDDEPWHDVLSSEAIAEIEADVRRYRLKRFCEEMLKVIQ
jgi:hypothetical protein